MLARKNRLTSSSEIERVVVHGARVRTSKIAIYSAPNAKDGMRFACVAGKKVHQSSVVRHEIQRKIRAACASITTFICGSYDIVVVALTKDVRAMSVQEVAREIIKGIPNV